MRTSVRLLSVIHPFRPAFSGEGEWWLRMVPRLQRRGVDVEILTGSSAPRTGRTGTVDGIVVHRVPLRAEDPSWWGRMSATTRELVRRRGRFDVALFHAPNHDAVYASCALGPALGWKTVYKMTLFGSDDLLSIRQSGRLGAVRLRALRRADGFISISSPMTRTFEQTGLRPRRLLTVPQGVDTERFRPADPARRRLARRRLDIPSDAPVALFCGALVERKGIDILLDAWREVIRTLPDALLLLVGPTHHDLLTEPGYRAFSEAMERRIHEEMPAGSVRLAGYQTEVERYYAAADVFVFPSRFEGCPSAVMEAMASGLPCVLSPLDGVSDQYLRDGAEGVVVRSPDPVRYAEGIRSFLTDPALARRAGGLARQRVVTQYSLEQVADAYGAFIHSLTEPLEIGG